MSCSLNQIYRVAGLSKQAVSRQHQRQVVFEGQMAGLILEADQLREAHPGCGVEKMYYTLKPDFIGRDRFIACMMQLGYRLKRQGDQRRTTYAGALYYPNLVNGLEVTRPHQVWQTDITYIRITDRFYYAVFIIDVYTRQIVGHQVSDHLRAQANIQALKAALCRHGPPQIHHSDRGSQYIHTTYIKLLRDMDVAVSMGLYPQENAYAERINRTIKEEYLNHWKPGNLDELRKMTKRAVRQYNHIRPHNDLLRMSPVHYLHHWQTLEPDQKPKMTIFNYQT